MKQFIFISICMMLALNSFGQAGIRVFTRLDEAKFKAVLDGTAENEILIKEVKFDSLNHKKPHQLVLSFSSDTIADIQMEIYLLKNQVREFQILRKGSIVRKTAKVGRKIGKALRIGSHDKEASLYDVYYLEERTKSEFMNN